ncbi:MAG TPA: amidohydrolase, partial [Colwellia sp.]|nr:amidohydrolase [Colwellia sp.]
MIKPQLISAIPLLLISSQLMAQTTLIKNVNGYTFVDKALTQFSAISFTDDTINKVYAPGEELSVAKNVMVIDGQGQTMLPG